MTTGKAPQPPSPKTPECCMCGDQGLSYELFNCKICQFRSQHRYCSNLYPKAETYKVCNWCLSDTSEKTQNSSNSSSSQRNNSSTGSDHGHVIKIIKKKGTDHQNHQGGKKGNLRLQGSKPIKKQRPPEGSAAAVGGRKKAIGGGDSGGLKERPRRTKSEDISNGGIIIKQVTRNYKVRRYKLLDEVSSQ